jgi:Tfp pilus assembly protein PilF
LRPDDAGTLNNRGNTLQELKRFDEALASYDRALTLRPNDARTLNNRGNTLKALKRLDEALTSYDRALSLRPDSADTLYNRGLTLHELKHYDEALASYDTRRCGRLGSAVKHRRASAFDIATETLSGPSCCWIMDTQRRERLGDFTPMTRARDDASLMSYRPPTARGQAAR